MNEPAREKNASPGDNSAPRPKKSATPRWGQLLAAITSTVALAAALMTISYSLSVAFFEKASRPPEPYLSVASELKTLEATLANHEKSITDIERRLQALANADPTTEAGVQVAALRSDVQSSAARIQTLEKGLLDSPEKALSVPLLRRDLENIKQAYKEDLETLVRSTDRVYDQNKWFIGLMFTMAIGLVGLAVSNFVQGRRKPEE
jgi:hypothetical protein